MPTSTAAAAATRMVADTALALLDQLIGDAEPDVQKALAWAYRSLAIVDRDGDDRRPPRARPTSPREPTTATARGSSATRLAKLDPADADELRAAPRRHPPARRRPVDLDGRRARPQRFGGAARTRPHPPRTRR